MIALTIGGAGSYTIARKKQSLSNQAAQSYRALKTGSQLP